MPRPRLWASSAMAQLHLALWVEQWLLARSLRPDNS